MKGIQCGFAHKALSAIDKVEEGAYLDLDYRLVAFLKEKGLVSAYSTWFYHEMLGNEKKLNRAKTRLKTTKKEADSYERRVKSIEEKLKSTWGYTKTELQEMRDKLADRKQKHAEKSGAAENLEERIERFEAMPAPSNYKLTIDGDYVILTDKAKIWLKTLSGRLEELGNAPMEYFEGMLEDFESRIDNYCARAVEAFELMGSRGFSKHSQQVIDCAVRLATSDYSITEAYNRMKTINDFLNEDSPHHNRLNSYDRLLPATAIAMQPENIGMLKDELIETYKAFVNNRYGGDFFFWWAASSMMELNRFDIEKNIERFEEVRTALGKNGWGGYSWDTSARHTCYMAANLARGMDSPEELTKQLRIQQQRLINTGRNKSNELSTASLILLDSEASLDERTDRFAEAWKEMDTYGWGRYYMFYPTAAALSVMPHSVTENVMWLDNIIKTLKDCGLEDKTETRDGLMEGLTYRALDILMAVYKGQFRREVMPHFIVPSENSLIK